MTKQQHTARVGRISPARAALGFALATVSGVAVPATAQTAAPSWQQLMQEAYDFAYPLYKLSEYRWIALNTRDARTSTTLNHFAHSRASATPDDKWADAPIVDALYSTAWLDLSRGPVWLDTPETHSRYYVLTLIDFYSNTFFYAGHRTTGTHAQRYFVAGPDWHGTVPAGTQLLRAPTNDVYVNLRVLIDGPKDQAAANAVQDGFRLTPVRRTPAEAATARVQPVPRDGSSFVDVVNQMIAMNPPPERDAPVLAKYRAIGICGAACSWEALPDSVKAQWTATYPSLEGKFLAAYRSAGRANGWIEYNPPGSKLGSTQMLDYSLRAMALSVGKGMLGVAPAEADYWMTFNDAKGQPLKGTGSYRLHFATGGLPADAFWSVALYAFEKDGQFLAANPINRYHVGSRTGLKTNPDGSLDIWIQSTPPSEDKRSNWLPAPADGSRFQLFARAYEPKAEILEGRFRMPEVEALP